MQSERAFESLRVAADAGMQHALVVSVDEQTTDAHVLRVVERAHDVSANDGGRRSSERGRAGRSRPPMDDALRADCGVARRCAIGP